MKHPIRSGVLTCLIQLGSIGDMAGGLCNCITGSTRLLPGPTMPRILLRYVDVIGKLKSISEEFSNFCKFSAVTGSIWGGAW